MADLQRLEYHLQNVRLLASVGSRERYGSKRKLALGACNRFFSQATSDREREYVLEVKRQIREVRYVGRRTG